MEFELGVATSASSMESAPHSRCRKCFAAHGLAAHSSSPVVTKPAGVIMNTFRIRWCLKFTRFRTCGARTQYCFTFSWFKILGDCRVEMGRPV